ncbi:hypothetical protein [Spirosoma koreense]
MVWIKRTQSEIMHNRNALTAVGVVIAYLSIAGISFLFKTAFGNPLNDLQVVGREAMIFLMAGLLLGMIRQEKLPLSSVGLYVSTESRPVDLMGNSNGLCKFRLAVRLSAAFSTSRLALWRLQIVV